MSPVKVPWVLEGADSPDRPEPGDGHVLSPDDKPGLGAGPVDHVLHGGDLLAAVGGEDEPEGDQVHEGTEEGGGNKLGRLEDTAKTKHMNIKLIIAQK